MASNNMINNAFIDNYTGPNKVSKNLIIGGNFDTNPWQRGTTFTAIANSTYNADRFWISYVSTAVVDITKTADAPTVAQASIFTQNCLKLNVTTADAAIAAGDYLFLGQRIEGYNFALIAQRIFTLSFWVKATKTGIYCVSFRNSGGDRCYVAEYTINTTATWEYKTITVSASPSAGTWDYTTGVGLRVDFALAAGSTWQTTANAWNVGSFVGTANQVNALDAISNIFELALIQVEAGSVATPFTIQTAQEVLTSCQRYYTKTFALATVPAQASGTTTGAIAYRCQVGGTAGANGAPWVYPVVMRAAPTVTTYNPISANAVWYNLTGGADSGAASGLGASQRGTFIANAQVAADAATNQIFIHAQASAEL